MSAQRNCGRRAAALAGPAGLLALAMIVGCDRSSQKTDPADETPSADETAAASDPGETPHAPPSDPGAADPHARPGDPAAPQGEPISDEELEAFAEAYLEIEDLQADLEAELRAAQSHEEAQEIQQRAMTEIREAVEGTGMDFETYKMIAQRLQQDPELIQRVEATIESKRDDS